MTEYAHIPVLLEETLAFLAPRGKDELMVDATCGEGGHSYAFLSKYYETGLGIAAVDADNDILAIGKKRLQPFARRQPLPLVKRLLLLPVKRQHLPLAKESRLRLAKRQPLPLAKRLHLSLVKKQPPPPAKRSHLRLVKKLLRSLVKKPLQKPVNGSFNPCRFYRDLQ